MQDLIGFLLPPVIAFVNQKVENVTLKFIVSIMVSIIAAVLVNFEKIKYSTPEEILSTCALIFAEAQVAYRLYWHKDSPVRQVIGK